MLTEYIVRVTTTDGELSWIRRIEATCEDEALTMAERRDAGIADLLYRIEADSPKADRLTD